MPIKSFRPITPTLRFQTKLVNDDLTTDKPHKPLLAVKQRTGGRNSTGRMTIRHQGGGPPLSRPLSTTRTAVRASLWCTMRTARSATSSSRSD